MKLVFFDFDDTMTKHDTTLAIGVFFAGQRPARGRLPLLVFALGLAGIRALTNTGLKRIFALLFFRGETTEGVRERVVNFYQTCLDTLVDDELLGRLQMHVDRGDSVYLVSANFDCLLEPLAPRWSLTGVIATKADLRGGVYTGGIVGTACRGREKLRRVIAHFGQAAVAQAVAYGNQNDAPLLRTVGQGYLVRRAKPPGPFGRFRRWVRILSGKLSRDDLPSTRLIEPFPSSRSQELSTGV
jgi:phosphatidylglycerophosphatase C